MPNDILAGISAAVINRKCPARNLNRDAGSFSEREAKHWLCVRRVGPGINYLNS